MAFQDLRQSAGLRPLFQTFSHQEKMYIKEKKINHIHVDIKQIEHVLGFAEMHNANIYSGDWVEQLAGEPIVKHSVETVHTQGFSLDKKQS